MSKLNFSKDETAFIQNLSMDMQSIAKENGLKSFKNPDEPGLIFHCDDYTLKATFNLDAKDEADNAIEWQSTVMDLKSQSVIKQLEPSVMAIFLMTHEKLNAQIQGTLTSL